MSTEVQKVKAHLGARVGKSFPATGKVTLSTGGGVHVLAVTGVKATDIVLVTLISDDTGTAITKLLAVAGVGQVTFTRTDDGSSNDDAVIQYLVVSGEG